MKKLIVKIVFGLVILPGAVVGLLYHLNQTGFFNVARINIVVTDNANVQKEFLTPLSASLQNQMSAYKNISLWKLPLKKISAEMAQVNWVENFSVKRSWPNTLTIEVQPYEVKMLFRSRNGNLNPGDS